VSTQFCLIFDYKRSKNIVDSLKLFCYGDATLRPTKGANEMAARKGTKKSRGARKGGKKGTKKRSAAKSSARGGAKKSAKKAAKKSTKKAGARKAAKKTTKKAAKKTTKKAAKKTTRKSAGRRGTKKSSKSVVPPVPVAESEGITIGATKSEASTENMGGESDAASEEGS